MIEEASVLKEKIGRKKISTKTIALWITQQLSLLGSTLSSFVLLWWVSETTHSEFILGIATLMNFIPYLIVTPFSGILIDKVNRKKMLFITDLLQAIFTVVLIIIFYIIKRNQNLESIILLASVIIILGLRGIMQVFHEVTITAIIPFLVEEEYIGRFNSVTFLGGGLARIAGVLLLNFIPIDIILWIDLVTFIITIIPLAYSTIPQNEINYQTNTSPIAQIKEGVSVIREIKGLLPTILIVPIANFFFAPMMSLLPLFVSKVHQGTEAHYAIVTILWQIGIIVSSTFMCFFKGFNNKIKTAAISISCLFIIQSLVIFIPTTLDVRFWLIGIVLFCAMLFNPIANVSFYAAIQIIIPKEKLGRVISAIFFIANAITPIGIFLSGVIGEYLPLNILFVCSGILGLVSILIIYFFTKARTLDRIIANRTYEAISDAELVLNKNKEIKI